MIYPFNILREDIFPIFGNQFNELPAYINLSIDNDSVDNICKNQTQREFNDYMISEMNKVGKRTALSGYLEDRTSLLRKYPQMVNENRVYHLGVDISAPLGTNIYAPLTGEVVEAYYEEGDGNYGGLIVLRHNIENCIFYSLYGHLNKTVLPSVGTIINKGDIFARLGDFEENGNWFHHTHLQVLTEKGYNEGWISKGYCSPKDFTTIDRYCPNPIFLLRF